jgi:hypothetical protein
MLRLKAHFTSVCFKCFIGMLQVFYTGVAKVDQDVAYVAMIIDVWCKVLSLMFHLFFSYVCSSVFIRMLHMFSLDVVYVYNGFKCFSGMFASVASGCFRSRSDIASSSLPLVASSRCVLSALPLRRRGQVLPNQRRCPPPLLFARAARAPREAKCRHGRPNARVRPDVWALTLSIEQRY